MAGKRTAQQTRFVLVVGGDEFLNEQQVRDCRDAAAKNGPEAEVIELDAGEAGQYDFDEAVSPSCSAQAPSSSSVTSRTPTTPWPTPWSTIAPPWPKILPKRRPR